MIKCIEKWFSLYITSFVNIKPIDDDDIGISRTRFINDAINMEGRDRIEI